MRRIGRKLIGNTLQNPVIRFGYLGQAKYPLNPGGGSDPPPPVNKKINVQRSEHCLNFIKYRAANGPFKQVGDLDRNYPTIESPRQFHSASHGGWAYLVARKETFRTRAEADYTETTNATEAQLGAKMVTSTAIPDTVVHAREDRRHEMRNAAIFCLHPDFVTDPQRIAIKQKLARCILNTVREDRLDPWNTTHYPRGGFSDDGENTWQLVYIVLSFLLLYDDVDVKISDNDFFPFTSAERTEIREWFAGWYEFFESLFRPQIIKAFPGYYSYTYTGPYGSVLRDDSPSPLWWQYNPVTPTAPTVRYARGYQKFLNNRRGFYACYGLMYQAKFGLGTGRADAYRWLYHNLRFATWSDGDFAEQHRLSSTEPAEGLLYMGSNANQFTWMLDISMKMGWTEIYNDFWVNGITAGHTGTGGDSTASVTPKSIKTILTYLGSFAKNTPTYERYASLSGAQNRTSSLRIRLYNVRDVLSNSYVVDVSAAAIASALAKDQAIEDIHLRRQVAGFYPPRSSDKVAGVNDLAMGFRGLNANIMFEYAARGGDWHPVQNPCPYPSLWATAYQNAA